MRRWIMNYIFNKIWTLLGSLVAGYLSFQGGVSYALRSVAETTRASDDPQAVEQALQSTSESLVYSLGGGWLPWLNTAAIVFLVWYLVVPRLPEGEGTVFSRLMAIPSRLLSGFLGWIKSEWTKLPILLLSLSLIPLSGCRPLQPFDPVAPIEDDEQDADPEDDYEPAPSPRPPKDKKKKPKSDSKVAVGVRDALDGVSKEDCQRFRDLFEVTAKCIEDESEGVTTADDAWRFVERSIRYHPALPDVEGLGEAVTKSLESTVSREKTPENWRKQMADGLRSCAESARVAGGG